MQTLKADTQVVVMLGPAVDKTDGVTLESGLVAAMDTTTTGIRISKNGAAWADRAATVVTTVYDEGWYRVTLKTGDVDTEGTLDVMYEDATTCLPLFARFQVVNANVYDSLFAAATTDYLQVDTLQLGGATQSATDLKDFADDGYDPATNKVQGVVLTDTLTTYTGNTVQTGDTYALANGATGFAAIDTVVDGIQTDLSNGTDGLGAIKADTAAILIDTDVIDDGTSGLVKIASDVASILVDTGTTLDTKLNDIQGGTFSSATDSLEAIRDRGDAAWTGSTVTSDSGTAQAGAAGTITLQAGASAVDDTYNGQLIYISSGTGAGQSRAISDYTGSTKVADVITNWGTTPDGTSVYSIYPNEITEITAAPTAAAVADAVWDENTTGHQTAGTFGQQVKDDIDAILVDTQTTLNDKIDVIDGIVDDILVDTAEIGAAGAGLTALATQASLDVVDGIVDNILVDTGTTLEAHLTDIKGTSFVKDTHSLTDIEGYVDILDDATSGNVKIAQDAAAVLVDTGTTLDTAIGTVDTVVDAIKVVTDKFAFTVANQVDANVESINATAVVGVGTSGNKWRA